MNVPIEESIRRIKQAVEWFPGATLPCERRSGKSTAILELIHERHQGEATYVTFMLDLAEFAKKTYRERFPDDKQPQFVTNPDYLRGQTLPIYVDECGLLNHKMREALDIVNHRVQVRLTARQ